MPEAFEVNRSGGKINKSINYKLDTDQKDALNEISQDLNKLKNNVTVNFLHKQVRGAMEKTFGNTDVQNVLDTIYKEIIAKNPELKLNSYKSKEVVRPQLYDGIKCTRILQALLKLEGTSDEAKNLTIDGYMGANTLFSLKNSALPFDFTKADDPVYVTEYLKLLYEKVYNKNTTKLDKTNVVKKNTLINSNENFDNTKFTLDRDKKDSYRNKVKKILEDDYNLLDFGDDEANKKLSWEICALLKKYNIGIKNDGVKELLKNIAHGKDIDYGTDTDDLPQNTQTLKKVEARIKEKAFTYLTNEIGTFGKIGEFQSLDTRTTPIKVQKGGTDISIQLPGPVKLDRTNNLNYFDYKGQKIYIMLIDGMIQYKSNDYTGDLQIKEITKDKTYEII